MKKHYLIYQITNNINGKIYIGKHETFNIDDNYFGSGFHLRNAINKYGLENFVKTILFELQNEEEMNLLEKMVVTPEFCSRKDVYNIIEGGHGTWSYVNSNLSGYGKGSIKRHNAIIKGHNKRNKKQFSIKWKNTFNNKRQNKDEFLKLRKHISDQTKAFYKKTSWNYFGCK